LVEQLTTHWLCWACDRGGLVTHDAGQEKLPIEKQPRPEGWKLVEVYDIIGFRTVVHCPECAELHARHGDEFMNTRINENRKKHHDQMWSESFRKACPYRWHGYYRRR